MPEALRANSGTCALTLNWEGGNEVLTKWGEAPGAIEFSFVSIPSTEALYLGLHCEGSGDVWSQAFEVEAERDYMSQPVTLTWTHVRPVPDQRN